MVAAPLEQAEDAPKRKRPVSAVAVWLVWRAREFQGAWFNWLRNEFHGQV